MFLLFPFDKYAKNVVQNSPREVVVIGVVNGLYLQKYLLLLL